MGALTPNERKDLAEKAGRAAAARMTPLQREARARAASEASALMRRLRKLIQMTDAQAEGWTEPWRE